MPAELLLPLERLSGKHAVQPNLVCTGSISTFFTSLT